MKVFSTSLLALIAAAMVLASVAREQGADSQFRMVGDRYKSPCFHVHKMDMAACLPYYPEFESCEHFDNVMS